MAVTEEVLLNVILDPDTESAKRDKAVAVLHQKTGKGRAELVAKYLAARAARKRSASKLTKAELEEKYNASVYAYIAIRKKLEVAEAQIETLKKGLPPRKTIPGWVTTGMFTVVALVGASGSFGGALLLGIVFSVLIFKLEVGK